MCKVSRIFKHIFPVKIDIFYFFFLSGGVMHTAKNFTFCWFWLGKMHQNGFSGAYIGFEVWWILWYWFEVSTIRGSCKIKMSGKKKCKMRYKSMKMELDLCSSAPWVPFYPYTMFQNPMSNPSCQKSRKAIITQKVVVTQSSNIVHCYWHIQKPVSAKFQGFSNTFSLLKLTFFIFFFCQGELCTQPKISHFVDFDWAKCTKMALVVHI